MKLYIPMQRLRCHRNDRRRQRAACRRKARELGYDDESRYGSTFAPQFGTTDGLQENPQAQENTRKVR
jgi:hypothetical protein